MSLTHIRVDQNEQPYEIDEKGSRYINYLHKQLEIAKALALEVDRINPNHPTLGAGYLQNMKALASKVSNG